MKNFTVISLVFCFGFLSIRNTLVITYFKINQDYIAENFCRNKSQKERMCNGVCQLNDMLAELDQQDESLPFPHLPTWKIEDYFFPNNDKEIVNTSFSNGLDFTLFYYKIRPSRLLSTSIFHPPQV